MVKKHPTRLDLIEASKKTLTRRDFLKIAGITAGATVMAAVAPQAVFANPLPSQKPEPATLDVWWFTDIPDLNVPADPEEIPAYGGQARAAFIPWLAKHPGVKLNITAHSWANELRANQLTAIASHNIPDTTYGESFVNEFARMGIYSPVSRHAAELFTHGPMAEAKLDDKFYGLPAFVGTTALMINLDVLERCGLPTDPAHLPTTWDQLLRDARAVSKVNLSPDLSTYNAYYTISPGSNYGTPMRVLPWFNQNHAPLSDEEGHPSANSKKAVDTWVWHNALMATSDPGSYAVDAYWNLNAGAFAYMMGWTGDIWLQGAYAAWFGSGNPRMVAVPLPLPPGGRPSNIVIGNALISAFKRGHHPDLALALVEEAWTQEDAQEYMAEYGSIFVPALKSLLKQWKTYDKLDAFPTDNSKEMARFTMRELLDDDVDSLPRWPNNTPQCWTDWNSSYNAIWGGNLSKDGIKTELDSLQKKLQADIHSKQAW